MFVQDHRRKNFNKTYGVGVGTSAQRKGCTVTFVQRKGCTGRRQSCPGVLSRPLWTKESTGQGRGVIGEEQGK